MPLPHAIARFNKRVTNRYIEPIARRSGGFAVVHHIGRRSGETYATPVNLFDLEPARGESPVPGGDVIVTLTYGLVADWAQNVLVGGGTVERSAGGSHVITSASVVDRTVAWPALPLPVRLAVRALRVDQFMRLSLG